MARDGAIITTWGSPVRGREAKSLEVFMDSLAFWGKQAADGKCSPPEAFFSEDGSSGMLIVRGKTDTLRELWDFDEARAVIAKAQLIVDDLKSHWYYAGDDEIQRETQIFVQAGTELGYM
jgi:hypothetical protein